MDGIIAAIDQGTTSTRCILFDHGGKIISVCQKEHTQIFPKPGWVEHDPLEIWKNTREVIVDAVHKSGLSEKSINAFGVTNQRETTFLWNKKTGKPLCNAIVWQDTRTDTICNKFALEGGSDRFREKTGLPLATYFSGPKITWLFENIPGVKEAADNGRPLLWQC